MHQDSPGILPPAAADRAAGVRLTKIHEGKQSNITNYPARSIYPKTKSVLTTEATPAITPRHGAGATTLPRRAEGVRSAGSIYQKMRAMLPRFIRHESNSSVI